MGTTISQNDEERLVNAVAEAWYQNTSDETRRWAKMHLHALTKAGITLTPPPKPDPVYPIRLTLEQKHILAQTVSQRMAVDEFESRVLDELSDLIANATPEER